MVISQENIIVTLQALHTPFLLLVAVSLLFYFNVSTVELFRLIFALLFIMVVDFCFVYVEMHSNNYFLHKIGKWDANIFYTISVSILLLSSTKMFRTKKEFIQPLKVVKKIFPTKKAK
jgi:hypothetical protein